MTMYAQQLEQYGFVPMNHQKPLFFPVGLGHIYDQQGDKVPGYRRVERQDTGDTLAIHSDKYRLISYEDFFAAFDSQIRDSGLDLTDMAVHTDMAQNGAKIYRAYVLPAYAEEIAGNMVALRIGMFNSYDGSMSARGLAGIFNFACANEAHVGRSIIDVKLRHTGDRPVETVIETIIDAAKNHAENVRRMRLWSTVKLMAEDVRSLTLSMPQAKEALANEMTAKFAMGNSSTLWDFHNVLSNWATHGTSVAGKDRARLSNDRHKRIHDLVEGKYWKEYEQV